MHIVYRLYFLGLKFSEFCKCSRNHFFLHFEISGQCERVKNGSKLFAINFVKKLDPWNTV